jgi:hypothetical protein
MALPISRSLPSLSEITSPSAGFPKTYRTSLENTQSWPCKIRARGLTTIPAIKNSGSNCHDCHVERSRDISNYFWMSARDSSTPLRSARNDKNWNGKGPVVAMQNSGARFDNDSGHRGIQRPTPNVQRPTRNKEILNWTLKVER